MATDPPLNTAMLLAAGRGERMKPLSDRVPKPLLRVGDDALIEHQLRRLARGGIRCVVINHTDATRAVRGIVGNGRHFDVEVHYSDEGAAPLGTAGGIRRALPLLGNQFVVAGADVWTDFDFAALPAAPVGGAHLVLVDNPAHHPEGDFGLLDGFVDNTAQTRLTYAGIGVYTAELIRSSDAAERELAPLMRLAAAAGRATGQHFRGQWIDVGTPERLAQVRSLAGGRD